jgi:hypothetical protein
MISIPPLQPPALPPILDPRQPLVGVIRLHHLQMQALLDIPSGAIVAIVSFLSDATLGLFKPVLAINDRTPVTAYHPRVAAGDGEDVGKTRSGECGHGLDVGLR